MRRYLVSFCNNDRRLRIAVVTRLGIERVIDLGGGLFTFTFDPLGITGICLHGDRLLVALQSREMSGILILDSDYIVQQDVKLPNLYDLHGICAYGSEIAAVSTGTNRIAALDAADFAFRRVLWKDDGELRDRDHLNDVHVTPEGVLIVSRFCAQRPDSLRSGAVFEVESGRTILDGLREPHSPVWWDGSVYVLESGTGNLLRARPGHTPERVAGILGYARGLAIDEEGFAVGLSGYRDLSRSRLGDNRLAPLTLPSPDPGLLRRSGVYFIPHGGERVDFVDTTSCGLEIYQILPVPE